MVPQTKATAPMERPGTQYRVLSGGCLCRGDACVAQVVNAYNGTICRPRTSTKLHTDPRNGRLWPSILFLPPWVDPDRPTEKPDSGYQGSPSGRPPASRRKRCGGNNHGPADESNGAHGTSRHAVPVLSGACLCRGDACVAHGVKTSNGTICRPRASTKLHTDPRNGPLWPSILFFPPWVDPDRPTGKTNSGYQGSPTEPGLGIIMVA